jgi:hypothetical protein
MEPRDSDLDRLLRAAANGDEPEATAPFGFDTRVVAQWRAGGETNGGARELIRLVRRVAVGAAIVITFASAGAYWQFSESEDDAEPLTNAYAIADNAIESGFFQ